MSLYNMMNGFNPACVYILPMLGKKSEEYPRFRDCFVTEDNNIAIFTRFGGGNRGQGYGEDELMEDENFIRYYDDDFDNTYATYVFKVPDKWKADFDLIMDSKFSEVSDEYVALIKEFYPRLNMAGMIDAMLRPEQKGE